MSRNENMLYEAAARLIQWEEIYEKGGVFMRARTRRGTGEEEGGGGNPEKVGWKRDNKETNSRY